MIVEVHCVQSSTVAENSGWPVEVKPEVHSFGPITDVIRQCASTKVSQLADHPVPRVLWLTTEHMGGSFFFGPLGARDIMTSDTKISMPVGMPDPPISQITELKESAFFKFDRGGKVEPCRRSISALLLGLVHGEGIDLTGLLHPAPAVEFPIRMLPKVPFLRVSNWPFIAGKIELEWTISRPRAKRVFYWADTGKEAS